MVEGGPTVLGDFFDHRLVDEVRIFIAPKLFTGAAAPGAIGGKGIPSPADALKLDNVAWAQVGADMLLTGAVQH
jgi:diaminohydroxyphosphoribosylaminopyrimidine deaminase/5-amino-6-(5-phosphoribosylamino)uracil reductase